MTCINPKCNNKALVHRGKLRSTQVSFCDSCLTGLCFNRLSVYNMFKSIKRGKSVYVKKDKE